jgi:hypothetical protein
MTNHLESSTSSTSQAADGQPSGWLKLSVVAAASVLAGGLAAAWWYQSTLKRFRQAEEEPRKSTSRITRDDSAGEA